MYDAIKNKLMNYKVELSTKLYSPPETQQFEINGQLSPNEFKKSGDKLTQVCPGWKWMSSSNPKYLSKYLDQNKQYLAFEKALCKNRISSIQTKGQQQIIQENGHEIIIINPNQQNQEQEMKQQNFRYYNMYIIYDEYHYTPRMFFSATDINGKPITNQSIRQDIQKQYLDKTLTMENFPFMENTTLPTVHPCKHANVLKSMSDAMRQNNQKVESHYALLIFLKFITSVIPTVQFDVTGELIFE